MRDFVVILACMTDSMPQVSLHIMVVYFWLVLLVIGSMFMWSIAALDFHSNFRVRMRGLGKATIG